MSVLFCYGRVSEREREKNVSTSNRLEGGGRSLNTRDCSYTGRLGLFSLQCTVNYVHCTTVGKVLGSPLSRVMIEPRVRFVSGDARFTTSSSIDI